MQLRAWWMAVMCLGLGACSSDAGGIGGGTGAGGQGGSAEGFSVSTEVERVRVRRGESVDVPVQVQRFDVEGDIEVGVEELPSAAAAQSIAIPAGSSTGTLRIETLPTTAEGGPQPIMITATSIEDTTRTARTEVDLYIAGPPGALDASFGVDGVAQYSVMPGTIEAPRDVVADSRGRILIAGNSFADQRIGFLLRLLNDGQVDETFGEGGEVHGFGPGDSSADQVLVHADDSLLVLAFLTNVAAVPYLRAFDASGVVDADYGTDGDVVLEDPDLFRFISRRSDLIFSSLQIMRALDLQGQVLPTFSFEPIPALESTIHTLVADSQDRVLFSYFADDWTIRRTNAD